MAEVPDGKKRFRLRPIELDFKTGLVGVILLVTALLAFALKWQGILDYLNPNHQWLNWRFVGAFVVVTNAVTWFFMHSLWRREFNERHAIENDRDNLQDLLNLSENERMTDVVTGVPNGTKLKGDLAKLYLRRRGRSEIQMILIDIKNFRQINKKYGFLKGDDVLRMIAQHIYTSMRRDEEMYKHDGAAKEARSLWKTLYRRYPGGDEFVFLIDGDQSAAIGFVVNRLLSAFKALTKGTTAILGAEFPLSFHCAVVPLIKGDTADDAFRRVEDCYMRAAEGTKDFTAW